MACLIQLPNSRFILSPKLQAKEKPQFLAFLDMIKATPCCKQSTTEDNGNL